MTLLRWLAERLPPRSAGRFLVVGAVNTLVGFSSFPVLYLLIGAWTGYLPIMVFCYIFNPMFSYTTHKLISFESSLPIRHEVPRYILYWSAVFVVNVLVMNFVADWGRAAFVTVQVVFTFLVVILNYFVGGRLIFARRNSRR